MPRKRNTAAENHERWLVSYADFITLLFAFFVVMFASSHADKTKAKEVSASVREALEKGKFGGAVAGLLGRTVNAKPAEQPPAAAPPQPAQSNGDLAGSLAYLNRELQSEIDTGKVKVELQARGLVISLREAAFFPSGDDTILPSANRSLEKIAAVIEKLPNAVRLEGHTDAVPIHNSRFHSNWELSAARGIAMLELFSSRYGIPSQRLCIAGYSDTMPVESNDSPEGRAHNRRVDVVIVNPEAMNAESRGSDPPRSVRPVQGKT
jgi:chemotaxis protein MotB